MTKYSYSVKVSFETPFLPEEIISEKLGIELFDFLENTLFATEIEITASPKKETCCPN